MAIGIFAGPEPASPCIDVCEMDETLGLCKVCLRTIDEIAAWSGMSDNAKRAVLAQLLLRRLQKQVA